MYTSHSTLISQLRRYSFTLVSPNKSLPCLNPVILTFARLLHAPYLDFKRASFITTSVNEAMKLVGDQNVWRSTVLNLGCHAARRLRHRYRGIKSGKSVSQSFTPNFTTATVYHHRSSSFVVTPKQAASNIKHKIHRRKNKNQ